MPLTEPGRYAPVRPTGGWGGEAATLGGAPATYTAPPPPAPPRPRRPTARRTPRRAAAPAMPSMMAELQALLKQQAQAERAAEAAQLREEISGYDALMGNIQAELEAGTSELERGRTLSLEDLMRMGERERATMAREFGSRGMGQAGSRYGAEARTCWNRRGHTVSFG
jgi:hypothetical protein